MPLIEEKRKLEKVRALLQQTYRISKKQWNQNSLQTKKKWKPPKKQPDV